MPQLSAITASSSAKSGLNATSLHVSCGVEAATCTKNAQKKATPVLFWQVVTVSWWKAKNHILQTIGAATTQRKRSNEGDLREN
jgi:hypothetical protein